MDNFGLWTFLDLGQLRIWDNFGLWTFLDLGQLWSWTLAIFKITFHKMFNRQLCCILCLGWLYRICLWRVSGFSYEKKRMASSVKSRLVFILQQLSCEKIEEGKRKGTRSSRIFLQQTIKLAGMKIDQLCLLLVRGMKLLTKA